MISRLIDEITKKNAPVVVGLDPNLSFVPGFLLDEAVREKGEGLEAAASAVLSFNKGIVDAVYDLIPAVKPQIAMYEQFGIPGLDAYRQTVEYCHEKGLIVIGDVKRGDIGSTSEAYARAHLGEMKVGGSVTKPFDEDFATVNPYLGSDGVKPFVKVCNECDRGIFVLVKTSNPSSGEFQDQIVGSEGRPLYELVADKVREWGSDSMDGSYSNVGAVVGATYPEQGAAVRALMPNSFILVPGYGAQGGKAEDLKVFFNKDGLGAIVNSSRGIIAAYTKEPYSGRFDERGYADAAREAVLDMLRDIRENALVSGGRTF
ncbi:MAG: orotidine-5'-phosphate decarboxylase [Lachnospiraceae bacterium]|nr:orotidine-5'-phosphate decarboxylase [Lachnospiraceae bacterium]